MSGLFFFFLTLPQIADAKLDFWTRLMEMLPRLLMLLFIQVLAGFFLRQYRSSMEEFRYYEAVLRKREDTLVSYAIRKELNDASLLSDLAKSVLISPDFSRLTKNETTTIIEIDKNSANEFEGFGKQVLELLRGTKLLQTETK